MAEIRKAFPGSCLADTKYCIKLTESSPVYRTNTRFFVHVVENQQSDRRKKLLTEEDRNAILSLVKQRRYGKSVAPFVVGSPGNRLSKNELPTIFGRNTKIHVFRCQPEMRKGLPGSRAKEGTKIFFQMPAGKIRILPISVW